MQAPALLLAVLAVLLVLVVALAAGARAGRRRERLRADPGVLTTFDQTRSCTGYALDGLFGATNVTVTGLETTLRAAYAGAGMTPTQIAAEPQLMAVNAYWAAMRRVYAELNQNVPRASAINAEIPRVVSTLRTLAAARPTPAARAALAGPAGAALQAAVAPAAEGAALALARPWRRLYDGSCL